MPNLLTILPAIVTKLTYRQRFIILAILFLATIPLPLYWLVNIQSNLIIRKENQLKGLKIAKGLNDALYRTVDLSIFPAENQADAETILEDLASITLIEKKKAGPQSRQLGEGFSFIGRQTLDVPLLQELFNKIRQKSAVFPDVAVLDFVRETKKSILSLKYDYNLTLNRYPIENHLSELTLVKYPELLVKIAELKISEEKKGLSYLINLEELKQIHSRTKTLFDNIVTTYSNYDLNDKKLLQKAENISLIYGQETDNLINLSEEGKPDPVLLEQAFRQSIESIFNASNFHIQMLERIYTQQLDHDYFQKITTFIAALIATLTILAYLKLHVLTGHLQALRQHLQNMSQGLYAPCFCSQSKDEFGPIGAAFDKMGLQVRNVIHELSHLSVQLTKAIRTITFNAEEQLKAIVSQESNLKAIVKTANEISNQTQDSSETMKALTKAAREKMSAEEVKKRLEGLQQQMDLLSQTTTQVDSKIDEMYQEVETAKTITDFMHKVSDQGRLLSLNAAIETAQVKEQQESFVKVTQDIQRFSETTLKAASETEDDLECILKEVTSARIHARGCVKEISAGMVNLTYINQELSQIAEQGKMQIDQFSKIGKDLNWQAEAAASIINSIESVSLTAEKNTEMINGLHHTVSELLKTADELHRVTNLFEDKA